MTNLPAARGMGDSAYQTVPPFGGTGQGSTSIMNSGGAGDSYFQTMPGPEPANMAGVGSGGMGDSHYQTVPEYGGGVTNTLNTAGGATTTAGMATGNPYLMGAGLAMQGAGLISGLYGKYKARQEAKKQYQDRLKEYERKENERLEDKERENLRRDRQESYFAGEYGQGLEDRLAGAYGGYRTPGGQ